LKKNTCEEFSPRSTTNASARLAGISILTLLVGLPLSAQVSSTFDADLEGWLVTGDNSAVWKPSGGNPGGCLDVNDHATGAMNYAIAPFRYLGDWSHATPLDNLSLDYYLDNTSSGGAISHPAFIISGPGGSASSAEIYPPELTWTTYDVPLDPAVWTVNSGDWPSILANVTSLRVGGEFVSGQEELCIDNVVLDISPVWQFVPCALADFNDGSSGDWSFVDCSSSNPGSGGNGGGYVQIRDATGWSYAYAPASFLGDWSSLDGSGVVTIDVRLLSSSGTIVGATEFIRLTGPGGVAHYPLDALDVPTSPLEWKTIEIPIDSAHWTMDSGSWAALLAEVNECRIQVEFVDGSEVVGFDNFGRLAAGCEVADGNVVIHEDSVIIAQQISMPEIFNCALNPADGELYAVARSSSAGHGLYGVTGSQARTKLMAYDRPAHLIFDSDGDAFVSENYGGNIFRLEWGGSSSIWVSGLHSGDDDPFGFTVAPTAFDGPAVSAGDLLVSDYGYGGPAEIWAFSPDVDEGELYLTSTTGMTVYDLAGGASGVVYGADYENGDSLLVIAPDGSITFLALSQNIGAPLSVVYDLKSDNLFVATDLGTTFAVYRVDQATGTVGLVADGFDLLQPCCLEFAAGSLWVTDAGWGRVYELALPIFVDGFELGDTSAWSNTVP
jgi:hypothetical protein